MLTIAIVKRSLNFTEPLTRLHISETKHHEHRIYVLSLDVECIERPCTECVIQEVASQKFITCVVAASVVNPNPWLGEQGFRYGIYKARHGTNCDEKSNE